MKQRQVLFSILSLILLASGIQGCATNSTDSIPTTEASPIAPASGPAMRKASDLVFQYRQQAAELRDMARRLELEAEVYAEGHQEWARQTREFVKDLRAAADIADEQVRLYRSQVPHNQLY